MTLKQTKINERLSSLPRITSIYAMKAHYPQRNVITVPQTSMCGPQSSGVGTKDSLHKYPKGTPFVSSIPNSNCDRAGKPMLSRKAAVCDFMPMVQKKPSTA